MKAHKEDTYMKDSTKIALLEQSIGHINETMLRLERKIDNGFEKIEKDFIKVDKQFEKVDKQFEKVDEHFTKIEKANDVIRHDIKEHRSQGWSQFRWLLAFIFGLFGTFFTVLIKGHIN
jgi:archaellum component FlaC